MSFCTILMLRSYFRLCKEILFSSVLLGKMGKKINIQQFFSKCLSRFIVYSLQHVDISHSFQPSCPATLVISTALTVTVC